MGQVNRGDTPIEDSSAPLTEPLVATDYAQQLRKLLPKGPAWEDAKGVDPYIEGFAQELARIDAQARCLFAEAFPTSTRHLLGEWERDWGLPDLCVGAETTVDERRRRLIQKVQDKGMPNADYFINLAARLGYQHATVFRPAVFRVGSRVGQRLYGRGWIFYWRLQIHQEIGIRSWRAGSRVGERLRAWGNTLLACVVKRYAPAHLIVGITYGVQHASN